MTAAIESSSSNKAVQDEAAQVSAGSSTLETSVAKMQRDLLDMREKMLLLREKDLLDLREKVATLGLQVKVATVIISIFVAAAGIFGVSK